MAVSDCHLDRLTVISGKSKTGQFTDAGVPGITIYGIDHHWNNQAPGIKLEYIQKIQQ
ncbi:hypothetical protein [Thauera sp. SDU_THAU2]|uniref:hypothetical protein n=1 Tax=Thauera sp. SDU_THAU2 TaxID=3136633 RepID=UPI00311E0D63